MSEHDQYEANLHVISERTCKRDTKLSQECQVYSLLQHLEFAHNNAV